jgi:hypothetical protein
MTTLQTHLWGGPLDGQELNVEEPAKQEMVVPMLTQWPPEFADPDSTANFIRHHYVFDAGARRYNYAGDWP